MDFLAILHSLSNQGLVVIFFFLHRTSIENCLMEVEIIVVKFWNSASILFRNDMRLKALLKCFKKISTFWLSKSKCLWLSECSSMELLRMEKFRVRVKGLWSESGSWSSKRSKFNIWLYMGYMILHNQRHCYPTHGYKSSC
jgi:hypothetical protein